MSISIYRSMSLLVFKCYFMSADSCVVYDNITCLRRDENFSINWLDSELYEELLWREIYNSHSPN